MHHRDKNKYNTSGDLQYENSEMYDINYEKYRKHKHKRKENREISDTENSEIECREYRKKRRHIREHSAEDSNRNPHNAELPRHHYREYSNGHEYMLEQPRKGPDEYQCERNYRIKRPQKQSDNYEKSNNVSGNWENNDHCKHKKNVKPYDKGDTYSRNEENYDYRSNRIRTQENNEVNVKEELMSDTEDKRRSKAGQRDKIHLTKSKKEHAWGREFHNKEAKSLEKQEKEKPTMELSGKLAEDSNTYKGVVIKYSQPPEARKPKRRWRWYIFKGDEEIPYLPLHRLSAYLIGRDRKVADIPTDHPSCSKQHAVLQYRLVEYKRDDGSKGRTVKPYIIDLESANGTFVNNRKIEPKRYVELMEKDVVKFGYSSREYVLLHEQSKDDAGSVPEAGSADDLSPVSLLRS